MSLLLTVDSDGIRRYRTAFSREQLAVLELRLANETTTVRQVMVDLGRPGRRTGAVVLVNARGLTSGVFTDSDLARLFEQRREHLIDGPISAVMTVAPTTISPSALLPDAIQLMSDRKISEVPVVDDDGRPVGLIDITDIIDAPSADDVPADAAVPVIRKSA